MNAADPLFLPMVPTADPTTAARAALTDCPRWLAPFLDWGKVCRAAFPRYDGEESRGMFRPVSHWVLIGGRERVAFPVPPQGPLP